MQICYSAKHKFEPLLVPFQFEKTVQSSRYFDGTSFYTPKTSCISRDGNSIDVRFQSHFIAL